MLKMHANRAALLAGVAGLAMAGSVAQAQDRVWNGGAGLWGTAANWTMPNVPDTFSERGVINAPGTYVVTMAASYDLGGLLLGNASATLNIPPSFTQRCNADITNNGTINLNNTGANASTQFTVISSFSLLGSGQLVMNANAANVDTAYFYWNGGGEVLTNGASHTIRGTGNIYTYFTNLGTVNADRSGLTLNFRNQPKTNSGTMKATAGGMLRFDSINLTQTATGILLADGGTVQFNSVNESGGTLTAMPGSQIQATGTSYVGNATINGTFAVVAGNNVRMNPDIQNNGTILVNDSGANAATQWYMNASATLNGPGDLRLNANAANLDTAYIYWNGGGEVLTNASTHLIHGTGNIYCYLTNNGVIRADVAGRTLQLLTQPKTNNNLITAVNGANLSILNCGVTNTGGTISAVGAGSTVTFNSAGVTGGNVLSSSGGVVNTNANTFDSVTLSGTVNVLAGTPLFVSNVLTNNATLSINPGGANSGTYLRTNNSLTLNGSGTLVLNANTANLDTSYVTWNGGGEVLTHSAGHTIRGTGNLYTYLVNNGTISADVAGKTLQLLTQPKTNNSVIRAINGANLSILNCAVTQNSPGALSATGAGSTLSLTNSGVTGGLISATGGGLMSMSNSTLVTLTLTGNAQMPAGTSSYFNTLLTNNGTITINPTGANAGTWFRTNNSATINGTGEIVLNANPINLDTAYLIWNGGGELLTHGANHTIRGTGRIYVSFDNLGAIRADSPGKVLELTTPNAKTNENLIQAQNGGTLSLSGVNLVQTGSGQVRAQGGTVSIVNSGITGGSLISNSVTDLFNINGTVTVNGIYNATQMRVTGGAFLRGAGSFTNAGNIVINTTAANSSTLFAVNSSLTVDGPGRFLLNAIPTNLDTAYLTWNGGGEVLTNGSQHAIAGTGRIYVRTLNKGLLSPGAGPESVGLLDVRTTMTCDPTSVVEIEIGGPTPADFDRFTGPAAWTIGGTLRISTINGFVPGYGTTYDIITYGSHTGTFASVEGNGWTVQYLPDRVRLIAICDADVNQDGNADQGDVDYLIDVVAGGANPTHIDPDFNRDGNVDQGDVDALINAVAGGGCD